MAPLPGLFLTADQRGEWSSILLACVGGRSVRRGIDDALRVLRYSGANRGVLMDRPKQKDLKYYDALRKWNQSLLKRMNDVYIEAEFSIEGVMLLKNSLP